MNDDKFLKNWQNDLNLLSQIFDFYALEDFHFLLQETPKTHFFAEEITFPAQKQNKKNSLITKKEQSSYIISKSLPILPEKSEENLPSSIEIPNLQKKQMDLIEEAKTIVFQASSIEELQNFIQNFTEFRLNKPHLPFCFSQGAAGKDLMVIEDRPSKDNMHENHPFAGKSGKFLEEVLFSINLKRSDVYLASYFPWENNFIETVRPHEKIILQYFLARHIVLAKPRFILAMGEIFSKVFFHQESFLKIHGQFFNYTELIPESKTFLKPAAPIPFMLTFSTSHFLAHPFQKKHLWKHLLLLESVLTKDKR